ncbi:sortase-dependent protein [Streptomyces sp. NPDC001848]|uniref:sortase-dependent protein n=1 Tax=Streptomyces sp. NPDC001848 TaxID=3364618 RepID=UPI0036C45347
MRRTVLSAMTLACTAVLAGTVPAFAHGASPTPAVPTATASPSTGPAPTAAPTAASAVPSAAPTPAPTKDRSQVSVVPKGAPDTGVTAGTSRSVSPGLIGGGAGLVLVGGGAAVHVVRRRRATGA